MKILFLALATLSVLLLNSCTDAGKNQTVSAGTKVILDASKTKTDVGGKITRYTWSQIDNEGVDTVHIFDKYTQRASFIAPSVSQETDIKFKLVTIESYNCKTEQDSSCRHHRSTDKITITVLASSTDSNSSNTDTTNSSSYNVAISGKITNETDSAVSGAIVNSNDKTISTKTDGSYSLSKVQTTQRIVLNVSHPDYFSNSRILIANLSNAFKQNIKLFHPAQTQTFNYREGATLSHNGASISFPADAVYLNESKKKYKGDVTVKMRYYSMENILDKDALPGSNEGKDASENFLLTSHGFIDAKLTDIDGNTLTLASNSYATLSFPATKSTHNDPEISLWNYDASSGYWLKDTKTDMINGLYVGGVNQIGTYGLQTRAPKAQLSVCVEDRAGESISGADILVSSNNWSSTVAQTDKEGTLSLENILADTKLTVTATKVIDGKSLSNTYPSTLILVEGETRALSDCIELATGTAPRPSTENNQTQNSQTQSTVSTNAEDVEKARLEKEKAQLEKEKAQLEKEKAQLEKEKAQLENNDKNTTTTRDENTTR